MKTMLCFFFVLITFSLHAQMYAALDAGVALQTLKGKTIQEFTPSGQLISSERGQGKGTGTLNLHIGYMKTINTELSLWKKALTIEYDQRALLDQENPFYFGVRAGYMVSRNALDIWPLVGTYYRLLNNDKPGVNYWIGGYGIRFQYKGFSFEVSKVEFYQLTVGIEGFFRKEN